MAKGTGVIIKTDGTTERHEFDAAYGAPGGIDLAWLQRAVGGYIEIVPYLTKFDDAVKGRVPCLAMCNEEGKIHALPFNTAATLIWHNQHNGGDRYDVLCGDVVIFFGDAEFMASL